MPSKSPTSAHFSKKFWTDAQCDAFEIMRIANRGMLDSVERKDSDLMFAATRDAFVKFAANFIAAIEGSPAPHPEYLP